MLWADNALLKPIQTDHFGTNTTREKSRIFSLSTSLHAELSRNKKNNWFTVIAPYDGALELHTQCIEGTSRLDMMHYIGNGCPGIRYQNIENNFVRIPVKKGKNVLRLYAAKEGISIAYRIPSKFLIHKDLFESNDRQY